MKKLLNISGLIILVIGFVIFILWISKLVPEVYLSKITIPLSIILLLNILLEFIIDLHKKK